MSVFYYDPFSHFERLFDDAMRSRNQLSLPAPSTETGDSVQAFRPKMDLHENAESNTVTATFELPGVKKEDIHIETLPGRLRVSAESKILSENLKNIDTDDPEQLKKIIRDMQSQRNSETFRLSIGSLVQAGVRSQRSNTATRARKVAGPAIFNVGPTDLNTSERRLNTFKEDIGWFVEDGEADYHPLNVPILHGNLSSTYDLNHFLLNPVPMRMYAALARGPDAAAHMLDRDLGKHEKDGYAVRERRYGKFARTLQLPQGVKDEEIKANMENGVLTVTFPKSSPEQAPKKISVA
ncbi:SHSP domain-containing protein [Mycena kentingensis (nom. inval.)]|nr:SHSP domain-containing protein [Mycena kentingensis (nom. inval.)]